MGKRLEDLNLSDDPLPGAGESLDDLPSQDHHFDEMRDGMCDDSPWTGPGLTGDPGASLRVKPSRLIH
jgi:hypothetical protein